jgi:hypothetical protein
MVATVHQHGAGGSGGFRKEVGQTKDAERRDKVERPNREEHGARARLVKNFRRSAMLQTAPLLCEQKAA